MITIPEAIGVVYGGGVMLFVSAVCIVWAVEDTKLRMRYGTLILSWQSCYGRAVLEALVEICQGSEDVESTTSERDRSSPILMRPSALPTGMSPVLNASRLEEKGSSTELSRIPEWDAEAELEAATRDLDDAPLDSPLTVHRRQVQEERKILSEEKPLPGSFWYDKAVEDFESGTAATRVRSPRSTQVRTVLTPGPAESKQDDDYSKVAATVDDESNRRDGESYEESGTGMIDSMINWALRIPEALGMPVSDYDVDKMDNEDMEKSGVPASSSDQKDKRSRSAMHISAVSEPQQPSVGEPPDSAEQKLERKAVAPPSIETPHQDSPIADFTAWRAAIHQEDTRSHPQSTSARHIWPVKRIRFPSRLPLSRVVKDVKEQKDVDERKSNTDALPLRKGRLAGRTHRRNLTDSMQRLPPLAVRENVYDGDRSSMRSNTSIIDTLDETMSRRRSGDGQSLRHIEDGVPRGVSMRQSIADAGAGIWDHLREQIKLSESGKKKRKKEKKKEEEGPSGKERTSKSYMTAFRWNREGETKASAAGGSFHSRRASLKRFNSTSQNPRQEDEGGQSSHPFVLQSAGGSVNLPRLPLRLQRDISVDT